MQTSEPLDPTEGAAQAPPPVPSPSPSGMRMVVALAIFAAAVGGGVFALLHLPQATKEKLSNSEKVAKKPAASGDEAAFFYDAIGRAAEVPTDGGDDLPAAGAKASYTLEIKVTSSRDEAEQLIDELHDQAVEAYYTPLTRAGRVVFRVRRGIYPSQREADKAALAMRQEHAVAATVVKLQ